MREPEDNSGSTGEATGYISLDQARALALQYAQDHREFYGNISEQELAWDALSAHETEHHFEVRLSFRSAGSFRTAGVEQINIGKTGSIESRQIINQPRLTRGFTMIAIAIAIVAVAGVIFGGLFAIGRPDTTNVSQQLSTSISITPETPARLISPDGEVSIELNANTVGAPAQLAYSALSVAEIPALPPEFTGTGKAFELTTKTPLLKPLTITVALSDADTALADGKEDNIVIQHYTGGAWTQLDTAVDSLSMFALTVRDPGGTPIQVPGAAQAASPAQPLNATVAPVIGSPSADAPQAIPVPSPTEAALSDPDVTLVPVPTAQPVLLPTATPSPSSTPVPDQEWLLDDVVVAGGKVTVQVRILGPSWFNITLDGHATDETIIDGPIRSDIFRNVPPGSHMVRVFTVGVPDQEDLRSLKVAPRASTLAPAPTPSGPPSATPIPGTGYTSTASWPRPQIA